MAHLVVGEMKYINIVLLIIIINCQVATLIKHRNRCRSVFARHIKFLQRQLYAIEVEMVEAWEMLDMDFVIY